MHATDCQVRWGCGWRWHRGIHLSRTPPFANPPPSLPSPSFAKVHRESKPSTKSALELAQPQNNDPFLGSIKQGERGLHNPSSSSPSIIPKSKQRRSKEEGYQLPPTLEGEESQEESQHPDAMQPVGPHVSVSVDQPPLLLLHSLFLFSF